jgi:hypothetical protein
MIKLENTIADVWMGAGAGDPVRVLVDHFKILRIDTDHAARTLTVSGCYGFLEDGEFKRYDLPGGSTNIFSKTILQGETFDEFQLLTSKAGAPPDDFRIADVEDDLIHQGLINGNRT